MKKSQSKKKPQKKAKKSISKKSTSLVKKSAPSENLVGFVPAGDRVLVRPLSAEEAGTMTSFGIIIPDSAKEKPEQGIVVAVGSGKKTDDGKTIEVAFEVGDKIMFNKYGYDEIKIAGKEYFIVSEANILGVLN